MTESRKRPRLQLRSHARDARDELLRRFMDDVTGRERRLADDVSRAEKTAKQLRSELASERNYSSRVRQEREEAKNKVAAVLKETAAARAAGEKTQEELSELRTSLEENKKKVAELEALVTEATRIKNRERFSRDEDVKKQTALPPTTCLCLSASPHTYPFGGCVRRVDELCIKKHNLKHAGIQQISLLKQQCG